MSRLLIKINNQIKELYGSKYIKLNSLDKNLEEIKVTSAIEDTIIEISGIIYPALVVQHPKVSNNYYHQVEITKFSSDLSIRSLNSDEKISLEAHNQMVINDSSVDVYLNYNLVDSNVIKYKCGDTIHLGDYLALNFKETNKVEITNYRSDLVKVMLPSLLGIEKEYKDFPIYTNSPKINYKITDETVELSAPPENEKKISVKDVVKKVVPSVITMTLTVIIAYFRPRGPYIIISLTTTIMAIIFAITSFISDRKENKRYNAKRQEIYEDYLKEQRAKLVLLKREEETILANTYLNIDGILTEVAKNSSRLYERDLESPDFLKINIGKINAEPTYTIKNPINKLQVDKEALELQVEAIYDDFKELNNVPKVVDLLSSNIGIIGSKDIINEQMQNIIMQLIFFHSYLDTKLIHVIDKKERKYYEKFVNTKHSQFGEEDIYSIVDSEDIRDSLFSPIIQAFREREEALNDKKQLVGTNFIFIISNYELMANHAIMEFLNKDKESYGFSILFLTQRHENLINNINTVIELKNRQQGEVVIEQSVATHQRFILHKCAKDEQVSASVMKIGQLQHIKGVKSSIPQQITFLEMYDVERVEDLQINSRWNQNQTYKTIKALLGKKTKTEPVYLDLHEKAHGPHGLIAGTTGSGKSEVIQTYILSLAANYSPYQVGFLLIDYKGGGMANLFENMPHLLGSITNLDGYLAMRAMASIKSELRRRQSLFSKHDVNHINGYHKLFESGKVSEPLPHLFLISDEFAELKSNEPEFMKELVSAARIGRSLGVHLILATQKPSGVVDDQIWSNSKFKLCLKVAEEADSRELLKTGDAAYITDPGRGYLKVGTNELYEQFQSGYSGATYTESKEEIKDNRIYLIDTQGKSHLINQDLSGSEKIDADEVDELRAVLAEINRVYADNSYVPIKKPWVAPLEDRIVMNQEVMPFSTKPNMKVSIGLIDIPDQQAQQELIVDFETDQSLLILGGPNSGKTSTIMTTVLSLARQNDATMLEFYLLDFGSSGLIQAKGLNQTADYIKVDELDKIEKFKKRIKSEIKRRRKLLEQHMVSNVKSYNEIASEPLKAIIIVIDNYDAIKDEGMDQTSELVKIIKDGLSVGIYPIISVSRVGVLTMSLQAIMINRIVHYFEERTELQNAIGRSDYVAQDIAGRVQLKLEKPEVAQIYFQCQGTKSEDILIETNKLIQDINTHCSENNQSLPVMPEVVEYKPEYYQENKIFIGLDYEDIKPVYVNFEQTIITGSKNFASSILSNIASQVKSDTEVIIIDNDEMSLIKYAQQKNIKYLMSDEISRWISEENSKLSEFDLSYRKQVLKEVISYEDFLKRKGINRKILLINSEEYIENIESKDKLMVTNGLTKMSRLGYITCASIDNAISVTEPMKTFKTYPIFITNDLTKGQAIKSELKFEKQTLMDNDIIMVEKGNVKKIKIFSK
ncbi:type VII secretion protein EssC [Mollicutes bacterium LVI A0039]|nr:type VII secretion protein EssC [Mollicutes bacterium LVI A0039]